MQLCLLASCKGEAPAAPACTDLGGPVDCEDALISCAKSHGVPVLGLCEEACEADSRRLWVCHGDDSPMTTGLFSEADVPRRPAAVMLEITQLSCATCERWAEAPSCVPGVPFCKADSPTIVHRCADDGSAVEPQDDEDDCSLTGVCSQAPCHTESPSADFPCTRPARCEDPLCLPGSIDCTGDEQVLVCTQHGDRQRVFSDCAGAGKSVRCGPEPVCVSDAGTPCDRQAAACPVGQRCTPPGPSGGPPVCVATAAEGEPCLGDLSTVCQQGFFCVVEYSDGGDPEPARGVCRPQCNQALNDCGQGRACVPISAGSVCSETLAAPHREPCDTGLASPCDRGVVVAGRGECVPVVPPAAAETCNRRDDDCDGTVDEGWDLQGDDSNCGGCGIVCGRDTFCEEGRCRCPDGFADLDGEAVNGCECRLGGQELCDGLDNDCDGAIDEDFDADGDGWPNVDDCGTGARRDCDDSSASVHPGAPELCDGLDQDCDGAVDETFDLTSDVGNCGECGRSCEVLDARSACIEGVCPWECPFDEDGEQDPRCRIECLPDTVDANGDMRDGCERSPCSAGLLPIPEVVGVYSMDVEAPAFLAWRERTVGVISLVPGEVQGGGPDRLASAAWPGPTLDIEGRTSTESLPGGPFTVTGLAWSPRGIGVLDGDAGRLLQVREVSLDAVGQDDLPTAPGGGAWRGLAHDGAVWWAALGPRVFRLVSMASPQLTFTARSEVAGLSAERETRRVFTSEADRICLYRQDGVCEGCWPPPAVREAAGGLAWDGSELWLVDPAGSQVLQTRIELP